MPEAKSILFAIPKGHRTDAICQALPCQREQENMWELIRAMIHGELEQTDIEVTKAEEGDITL